MPHFFVARFLPDLNSILRLLLLHFIPRADQELVHGQQKVETWPRNPRLQIGGDLVGQ